MSHVTHMNESCHAYEWVMSHVRMTHEWVMSHQCNAPVHCMHESCLTITATHCNILQHTATHCNTLQHTITQALLAWAMLRYDCMRDGETWALSASVMVRHDSSMRDMRHEHSVHEWLWDMTHPWAMVRHEHIVSSPSCTHTNITLQHTNNTLQHNTLQHTATHCNTQCHHHHALSAWAMTTHGRDQTQNMWISRPTSFPDRYLEWRTPFAHVKTRWCFWGLPLVVLQYVWHDDIYTSVFYVSFVCVAWLIRMCGMTHLYVWHDSFVCVTWLICMCDMTHLYVWHDSFICVLPLVVLQYLWHDSRTYVLYVSFLWVLAHARTSCPPKNGEIALWLATNRGCVVKYVSQKWNESNNKYTWFNILVIGMMKFNCTRILD